MNMSKFKEYMNFREGKENLLEPHTISADPPMKLPAGIERLAEAFKKSKEVPIGKEVDSKSGGEKDVTLKSKKLYLVGDAVRDYLLGHTPSNYQLRTDAHPEEIEKILVHARPPIQVTKKNGSVKVVVDGETYEIETMKKNGNEGEDIFTTEPGEDCERCDFTVNSLYYDISAKKIIDHTGGIRHIQDGTVKFVGNAGEKMSKDGTSKHRYAHMLNKIPNAKADKDIKAAMGKADSEELAPEKVREEFWKGMEDLHTNAEKYLKTYSDLGLLQTVFPKLELSLDFPTCRTCKSRPMVLASLLKTNKPQMLVNKLRELKYTDREIKDAVFLINLLVFSPEYIYDYKRELMNSSLSKRQIIDWTKMNKLDQDMIEKLIDYKLTDNTDEETGLSLENRKEKIRTSEAENFMHYLGR
jgi:tRNA nucleotidyltransferase/poly(A) polymerase